MKTRTRIGLITTAFLTLLAADGSAHAEDGGYVREGPFMGLGASYEVPAP